MERRADPAEPADHAARPVRRTPARAVLSSVRAVLPVLGRGLAGLARAVLAPLTVDVRPVGAGTAAARRRDWLLLADLVIAVVLYAVAARALIDLNNSLGRIHPPQLLHLLAAAGTLPVAVRRRRPLLAWQLVLVGVVATSGWLAPLLWRSRFAPLLLIGAPPVFVPTQVVAFVLCLYAVTSRSARTVVVGAWVWSVAGLGVIALAEPTVMLGLAPATGPQDAALWAASTALVTVTALFGHNVRTRRRAVADLEVQERRSRHEQAERAKLEERSRIARELHDVVAHNMSVIAIQAEAAPLRAPGDAAALRAELAGIRATALETLIEMRRVLGVLRGRDEAAETSPAPGIDRLDALLARVRAAGMDVEMAAAGTPRPVAPGVGVSAYRIVQESLSNALRHAPGARVAVALTYRDDPPALVLVVRNDPPQRPPPPRAPDEERHGLVGMRERVAMLHGSLRAEPTPAGGFVVEATLPLEDPA